MEALQQTVKITDGMLRALVQRLSNQIDGMGTAAGHAEITSVAKQLEASLTQVQRVHEQLDSTLARAVEHEQTTKQAAGQQKESAESALVTDKLSRLAAIFGGPSSSLAVHGNTEGGDSSTAMARLETKIDALTARFDKAGKGGRAGKLEERLTAIHDTLVEVKDHTIARASNKSVVENSTPANVNPSANHVVGSQPPSLPAPPSACPVNPASAVLTSNATGAPLSNPSAPAQLNNPFGNPFGNPSPAPLINSFLSVQQPPAPNFTSPDRKRKRESEDVSRVQPMPLLALSDDQKKKLSELARFRSVWESALNQLLPCPDGGLWV